MNEDPVMGMCGDLIVWLDINEEDDTVVEWIENLLSSLILEATKILKDELKIEDVFVMEYPPPSDQVRFLEKRYSKR